MKKLERNWARWKGKEIGEREASSSGVGTLKGGYCYDAYENMHMRTNIFLFLLSIFLNFIFLFF